MSYVADDSKKGDGLLDAKVIGVHQLVHVIVEFVAYL